MLLLVLQCNMKVQDLYTICRKIKIYYIINIPTKSMKYLTYIRIDTGNSFKYSSINFTNIRDK